MGQRLIYWKVNIAINMQIMFIVWLATSSEVLMNKEFDRVWNGTTKNMHVRKIVPTDQSGYLR